MSGLKLKQAGSSGNISDVDEKTRILKTTRSVTHGRSPSVTGVKSKIPKNVNQNRGGISAKSDEMAPEIFPERPNSQGNLPGRRSISRNGRPITAKQKSSALGMHRRSLESKILAQKHSLMILKKDIDEKQKNAIELVKKMNQLRDKLIAAGGDDPGKIDSIKIFTDQPNIIDNDKSMITSLKKDSTITKELIFKIKNNLDKETNGVLEFYQIEFNKNCELLKNLYDYFKDNDFIKPEILQQLIDHKNNEDNVNLNLNISRKKYDDIKLNLDEKIDVLWSEIESSYLEIKKISSVGSDVNEMRQKLNEQFENIKNINDEKILLNDKLNSQELKIKELENLNLNYLKEISKVEIKLKEENLLNEKKIKSYEELLKRNEEIIQDLTKNLEEAKLNKENVIVKESTDKTNNDDKIEIESLKEKLKMLEETCNAKILMEKKNLSAKYQEKLINKDKELKDLKTELQKIDKTYEIAEQSRKIKSLEIEIDKLNKIVCEKEKQLLRCDEIISILKDTDESQGNSKQMKISDIMKTLEEKIGQINNLEIIVKQFENQERSSQEQRTRLERRIAQLELEKNYQNNNRNKKFGII